MAVSPRDAASYEAARYEMKDGEKIGRDPRTITPEQLELLGHGKCPLLKAIRNKCLDCCVYQRSEVRKCVSATCALWPYRMGTDPFTSRKGNPAAFAGRDAAERIGQDAVAVGRDRFGGALQ